MEQKFASYKNQATGEVLKMVFQAKTRGNKWLLQAYFYETESGGCYEVKEYKHGSFQAMSFSNTVAEIQERVKRIIEGSKEDGISYITSIDYLF